MGVLVNFESVGRGKNSWSAKISSNDDIYKQLKKYLMSNNIDWGETKPGEWSVYVGGRTVGKFYEVEKGTLKLAGI